MSYPILLYQIGSPPGGAPATVGFNSLIAFWIGGGGQGDVIPPPPPPTPTPVTPSPRIPDSFSLWSPPGIGGRRTRVRSWLS